MGTEASREQPRRPFRAAGRLHELILVSLLTLLSAGSAHAHGAEHLAGESAWWTWGIAPEVTGPLLLLIVIYIAGMWRRADVTVPVARWRHWAFFGGLGLLFLALQSPIDPIAERLFSVHQVQHLLLRMIGPMLLALAAPQGILIAGLPSGVRRSVLAPVVSSGLLRRLFGLLTRPAVALGLFIAALYVWEIPALHNAALLDEAVHWVMHVTMLAAGLLFFWLIFDRRSPPQGWRFGVRLIALLLTILSNILLGGYTTLKETVLYDAYDVEGRLFGFRPLADELIGGYTIWVPSSMMCVIAILIVVHGMNRHEERVAARRDVWTPSNSGALAYPTTAEGLAAQAGPKNRAIALGFVVLMVTIFSTVLSVGVASQLMP